MHNKNKKRELILGLVTILLVAAAWFVGTFRSAMDATPFIHQAMPGSSRIEPVGDGVYSVWTKKEREMLSGYAAVAEGQGFGGPVTVVVAAGLAGYVTNVVVVDHSETPSYMRRVLDRNFLRSLQGKKYIDCFIPGEDMDGVTGATATSRALADAARRGLRNIASNAMGFRALEEPSPAITFGLPEICLILLFLLAFLGTRSWFPYKRTARWATLLLALGILGFAFNRPLTLIHVNNMLLGIWPAWQTHLYWYLLPAFTVFFILLEGKNLYCDRVCPFGAVQETLGAVGGAKLTLPPLLHQVLRWTQRILALFLVISALALVNPVQFNYEVYGALFHLAGSLFLFILLGLVLVSALLVKRPWCDYLCPIRPITDLLESFRKLFRRK